MNSLMHQYISVYNEAQGADIEKVKHVLMFHSHKWDWNGQDTLISDLIDDQNIAAADIVEFLESIYAIDGGNKEFSCAIKAMKVCLQKAKMQDAKPVTEDFGAFEDIDGNEDTEGSASFVPSYNNFLKYQPLSH